MKLQLLGFQCRPILRKILVALCFAGLALSTPAKAGPVVITGLVDTPSTLSFNFSGSGISELVVTSLPALTNWATPSEIHTQNLSAGTYFILFANLRHLPSGSLGALSMQAPFGINSTDITITSDGPGQDSYFASITVNR